MNDIQVSIICKTYNHKKYIEQAIKSFLSQQTHFEYEVIIHDDASNDGTADTVNTYARQYRRIVPIFQRENQYSQGVSTLPLILNKARGKYIAICEGDDYFLDPEKLEIQFNYMEAHPECSLHVHQVQLFSERKQKAKGYCTPFDSDRICSPEDVIMGGGGLFGTNSMFYRRTDALEFTRWVPKCSPVGDYPAVVFYATKGLVCYSARVMSCYRVDVPGSWTSRLNSANSNQRFKHIEAVNQMLKEIDIKTDHAYSEAINRHLADVTFDYALAEGDLKILLSNNSFKTQYRALPLTSRAKARAKCILKKLKSD